MPIMGRLSDRWGYRPAFLLATRRLHAGVGRRCVGPPRSAKLWKNSPGSINIVGRSSPASVQAIGAGAVIPISLAAAESLVGKQRRIVAYGLVGASAEAGSVFGPVWAGAIADWIGWEYTFLSNVPLALIAVIALAYLPKGIRHDTHQSIG